MRDPFQRSDDIEPRVHDDPNSREALRKALEATKGLRRAILSFIAEHGPATCAECHHLHPVDKHQAVSAALNGLREAGLVWYIGKRPNEEGNDEWVRDLTPHVRSFLGLPPGPPEVRPGTATKPRETVRPWSIEAVPRPDRWSCNTCGAIATMASHPHLQPALGGFKQGRCLNATCSSNDRTPKTTFWQPRKE